MSAPVEIRIGVDGTLYAMHSDATLPLLTAAGDASISRASHVEPDGLRWGVWTAAGEDTGRRFDTRAAALAWEVANFWMLIGK